MIAVANQIRTQQGLPALIGDPVVSVAGGLPKPRRLPEPVDAPGTPHEDLSKAGATGYAPPDRCAAVGTTCGAEDRRRRQRRGLGMGLVDDAAAPQHRRRADTGRSRRGDGRLPPR